MTDREFAETFMKTLYSKTTGKVVFSIYPITKEEVETLEPLIGYPDFEFTDRQRKVYGALQRKYGLHYWQPRERPLRLKVDQKSEFDYNNEITTLHEDIRRIEYNMSLRNNNNL